ncbi:MAG: tetratricopeptide repeat protein [Bordetella sp.]|uniref:tetratricopeptide repeat protein n=1 Tax=Bordetella sp. TaxID=28081 RepID=UPI003F7C0B7A
MNTQVTDAIALVRQGIELAGQQRLNEAVASFDGAIALKPDFLEALLLRGIVLFDLGRHEDAVASYDRVLAFQPDAQAYSCRGLALYSLGRFAEAVASYDHALELQPDAEAFDTRGAALYRLGRLDEAVVSYDRALALKPDADIFTRRGAALHDLGRFGEAVASYDRALALKPDYVEALNSRGVALDNLRRHDEALASYDRALALKPDHAKTHWNRSLVLLRQGDLRNGFEAYRWRFLANEAPRTAFACPEWQGEPLAGKRLAIYHEQGYGDTLQFVRYVPMAVALGAQVTLLVPQALTRLMRASLPGVEVATYVSDQAVFDFHAPMLSLPAMFGTTLDTIPARTPYLIADRAEAAGWAQRLAALPGPTRSDLKVGLVWAGGKKMPIADARRSLKLAQFAPLAAVPGVRWISLQIGEPAEEARTPPAGLELIDWTSEIRDYADTAALVAGLDLVITVDTSVAHLVGGLGKPVWILSRYDGCWRWLLDRNDSPWYPTARLFHQPALGQWEPVVAELATALQAFSSRHGTCGAPTAASPRRTADAVAILNRGVQLAAQQRYDQALADFDAAIALDDGLAEAFNNRGTALYKLDRFDEAAASYGRALALKPDAETFGSRGLALHMGRRLDEALASYDSALALEPDYAEAHYNRALTLLRAGDLARGFQAYRWRFRIHEARPAIACPEWEGEPLAGKRLVIFHEQGAGDSLQFVRYVPMAAAFGAHVTLLVPPVLTRLLRASLPGIDVVDRLPDSAVFDFQVPMLSLPAVLGTTLDTIPADVPYLAADRVEAQAWAQRLAAARPGLNVGLVWAGSSKPASYDGRRSLKPAQLTPLAAVCGIRWISLQIGEPAEEARKPPAEFHVIDWTNEIRDYADTAALVVNLDLVITVDTSVAHLAGALGRPVWILSRYDGCWRWLLNRGDSPWYPTARLFHQPAMGDWQSVIADVAAALQALVCGKTASRSEP